MQNKSNTTEISMTTLTSPLAEAKNDTLETSGPGQKKKDKRFIRLQVVENEIKEFNLLKIYLLVMMVPIIS